jgi:hypothetical protein
MTKQQLATPISRLRSADFGPADLRSARVAAALTLLRVGGTAAGLIYLAHPNAREIALGCAGKNFSNQLFAKADRKASPAFSGSDRKRGRHHLHIAEGR